MVDFRLPSNLARRAFAFTNKILTRLFGFCQLKDRGLVESLQSRLLQTGQFAFEGKRIAGVFETDTLRVCKLKRYT